VLVNAFSATSSGIRHGNGKAIPEDVVLQKLVLGRGSQPEKQWRDVLGVLKLQGDRLDFSYLWRWADELGLAEALDQALREAGL
jgi:hypothetical protein